MSLNCLRLSYSSDVLPRELILFVDCKWEGWTEIDGETSVGKLADDDDDDDDDCLPERSGSEEEEEREDARREIGEWILVTENDE